MRCFIERLAFITLSYDDPMEVIFPGHINTAFFFTMNMQTEQAQMYKPMMKSTLGALSRLGGSVEQYLVHRHAAIRRLLQIPAPPSSASRQSVRTEPSSSPATWKPPAK